MAKLTIIQGPIGSGKSTIARRIADETDAYVSDYVRQDRVIVISDIDEVEVITTAYVEGYRND